MVRIKIAGLSRSSHLSGRKKAFIDELDEIRDSSSYLVTELKVSLGHSQAEDLQHDLFSYLVAGLFP
jgi:hypothetical protein